MSDIGLVQELRNTSRATGPVDVAHEPAEVGGTQMHGRPEWLDRLDHKYEVAPGRYPLEMLPSEYFKRQCVISSDPDESMTGEVAQHIGPEYCIWASDYPHIDASFGAVPELMRHIGNLDETAQRGILGENALRFYGLEAPTR